MDAGNEPDLTTMANRVIDRALIPGRHREPRLAAQLAQAERIDVATPHGNVAAWRVGTGPAALLVHGFRDSARVWDPLMAELRARGRAFAALDMPGHGFSEGERCGPADISDALAAVAKALGPIDAMVAHSAASGGTVMAVEEGVAVERLVLIAPPISYRNPGPAAGDATDVAHQRWRRIAAELGFDPTIGDQAIEIYNSSLGPSRARWDLSDALANLKADVLFVASVDDERFDVDSARAFCQPMANVEFVTLTGLDHRASARHATAVDAIASFLDRR
jgi:pimeloyl-ACP methyl ester carboxylesterase